MSDALRARVGAGARWAVTFVTFAAPGTPKVTVNLVEFTAPMRPLARARTRARWTVTFVNFAMESDRRDQNFGWG